MSSLLSGALQGGLRPAARPAAASRIAVLAGAGGTLGSAVLEHALTVGGFARVRVLVTEPVAAAMRGFEACTLAQLHAPAHGAVPDTGFIVFDRERHANGREAAFLRPQPERLLWLAQGLHAAGVRRLIVVLPHAPATLPLALQHGLANLDEQALAALHFEQLVLVRPAQSADSAPAARGLQRLAHALLAQLHWMLPQQQQPVRAAKVAAFVAELARQLPDATPGTRVVPPALVWQAAQEADVRALVQAWLRSGEMPAAQAAARRW